ncbi:MAG TPA: ACP S-malonyltransferase [Candidatus Dormibacteraeota bacterium]|nr:ACP S-malonyltransferase [Candidatus Dormibacteraeota bacterium]
MTGTGSALLFPGQGAQAAGMGLELVAAGHQPHLLRLAAEQGVPLEQLLVTATTEQLRPTEVAQPALFYTGVALSQLLLEGGLVPVAAAGHSLGEYCAVVAAGSMSAEDGMTLVLERGRLMAAAPPGTMAAVLGLERERLESLCREAAEPDGCCVVANDNAPGQLVVSGSLEAIERLAGLARTAGARRVVPLPVGGAFHSPLMAESAAAFRVLLDRVAIANPRFGVAAGVSGTISHTAAEVRRGLEDQLAGSVRWADSVQSLARAGAATFLECGPGSTLAGLVRRILPGAETISVDSPQGATRALSALAPPDDRPLGGEQR